jgi:hypothetical protein
MKSRLLVLALTLAFAMASDASAQRRYGGYGGYGGGAGSTAFGSAMLGIGAATAAAGSYNLNTSMAAQNYQDAYRYYIENQKLRVQTYFDMRRMNASYRAEQEMMRPHATSVQIEEFNRARLPEQLSANELDAARGIIQWPGLLNRPQFDDNRARLEGLFAEASADPHGSGLGTQNYRDIQDAVGEMSDKLHAGIKQFSPDEYIPASKFLKSLAFSARSPGGDALAKK